MNGTQATRQAKPPPTGPTPPAPTSAPPVPPNHRQPSVNGTAHTNNPTTTAQGKTNKKKPADPQVDASQIYETLKNKIAALEEDAVHEEEEEKRFAEEARKSVSGMGENAVHAKYIELFAELKRLERDHAKEKQKLLKDKDAAKGQLTKANQTKTKMENLARELQKDNKRLRVGRVLYNLNQEFAHNKQEDTKRLSHCVEEAQDEISKMKDDIALRAERAKIQDTKYREMPDIVIKVVCRYRAELFFKISRKTKLSRLFNAWTERMETGIKKASGDQKGGSGSGGLGSSQVNGTTGKDGGSEATSMQFLFTHAGRMLEADSTPEDASMEDGDEILAVELMDLTEGPGIEEKVDEPHRQKLKKSWTDDILEAQRTVEEIFDGVIRERLKDVLRQYELREKHFECVIRSKELEVLLSRARWAEQKQLADGEKKRAEKSEDETRKLRKELDDSHNGQTMLVDKLIAFCKEPGAERTHRLLASLREELERRGMKLSDSSVGG